MILPIAYINFFIYLCVVKLKTSKDMERTEKVKEIVKSLLANKKVSDLFFALCDRWRDEKMYEDWNEYEKIMKKAVSENSDQVFTNFKATKRPFGLKFNYDGFEIHLFMQVIGQYATFKAKLKYC